jgi:hypothetical protein
VLLIEATTTVRVISDSEDGPETEAIDTCHEYDDKSPMHCGECGHAGKVADFDAAVTPYVPRQWTVS